MSALEIVLPGQWLGMVGGGQLARMFCFSAQRMGYKVAILDPDPFSPAGAVADKHICASYDDGMALLELAELCPAITTEFENVPAQSLMRLAEQCRVTPSGEAVAIAQDRIREKQFITKAGVPIAPYCAVHSIEDLLHADAGLFPGILKAARFGYDGKGQARVQTKQEALQAFANFGQVACVLESLQPLVDEVSVVVARGLDGTTAMYAPSHNQHRDGILAVSTAASANTPQPYYAQAQAAAVAIAAELNYYGVLCVEFFVLADGTLLANEIAPRPHNSGHFTIEACYSSQFDQQVRVMTGLPLGSTAEVQHSKMFNLLGDLWFDQNNQYSEPQWARLVAIPGVYLHLYGKAEARQGRKMGHVTLLATDTEQLQAKARQVAQVLGFDWYE
ncbi:5-(carboxyamino)imidazole ribonucleotide synthase [Paenalcaligenes hominis]|uniref:N5-carboxyaminoimidazole ribonucleotide synthase n=1 Tax=Paenalcaligenes hominis TaxID=643674 RepID=A0ABX0WNX8_9BURK|nr:5-(carboxyamino)imidazole ribonucleotide synthase [Paenalcaligenes hominis]NJB64756.1 5-(carboxyamino)imidazole ribonucleotide synthase [Paenalcaligenes hominis]GGE59273.1 N5-carboxyaminoimidazole ribonucleotide synthase [Paenalcaligenes hominis]